MIQKTYASICAGYLMPHPPVIIPAVGHGREHEAAFTLAGCQKAAERIAEYKPDTIVVISPHAHLFSDYLFVYDKTALKGSFARFDSPETSYSFESDEDLRDRYIALLGENGIKAGGIEGTLMQQYGLDRELDHGVLVPLHFVLSRYSDFRLLALSQSAMDKGRLARCGELLAQACQETGRRVCVIASGDMSHKVNSHSPYGIAVEGAQFDEAVCEVFRRGRFSAIREIKSALVEKSHECGYRSLLLMEGALGNGSCTLISYEAPFGIGYCVGEVLPGGART